MAEQSHTMNPTTANHDPVVDLYDRLVAMRDAHPENPDDAVIGSLRPIETKVAGLMA